MIERIKLPYLPSTSFPSSSIQFFKALRHLPLPILLHSGFSKVNKSSRFDILVAAPSEIFRYQEGILQIEYTQSTDRKVKKIKTSEPILTLSEYFSIQDETDTDEDIPFYGGLLGYFAYDAVHEAYKVSRHYHDGPELPSILAGLYDWALVIDHQKESCTLVADASYDSEKLKEIERLLKQEIHSPEESFKLNSAFTSNFSVQEYAQAFDKIMHYIHAGDCYQVNMSQCFQAKCQGDSLHAFSQLQQHANAPFAAYIEHGNQTVLSFSPECFLQVRNKKVLTQPIKGTRARYSDEAKDKKALEELQSSKKDKAENLMIVDLLRNDLGKVCRTGSVHVDALYETQSFTNVHHLISTVSAELLQVKDVFRLLHACFPGGSITGAPKQRAMEIIAELETMPRSVYCGSIVWINMNGDMNSNIAIRTLVHDRDSLYCWGGGGIVADSDMQMEYQESLDKISMFMDALS